MTEKASIAYLTSPSRGVYVLKYQVHGSYDVVEVEISKGHLANIIIDGTTLALRDVDHRSEQP